jgi:hypothetical protein
LPLSAHDGTCPRINNRVRTRQAATAQKTFILSESGGKLETLTRPGKKRQQANALAAANHSQSELSEPSLPENEAEPPRNQEKFLPQQGSEQLE